MLRKQNIDRNKQGENKMNRNVKIIFRKSVVEKFCNEEDIDGLMAFHGCGI